LRLEHPKGQALRLGKTWKIARLESRHLGKYPWEVATWENSFGKVHFPTSYLKQY